MLERDYLLPNLKLKQRKKESIGRYGLIRLNYLKTHKKVLYQTLLMSDELTTHLVDIDNIVIIAVENIINKLVEKDKVTKELKATNQFEWVGKMNNIKNQAEEIVLSEIIFN